MSDQIEIVARALWTHRWRDKPKGGWQQFSLLHPDIAQIYRENAEVAIDALRQEEQS